MILRMLHSVQQECGLGCPSEPFNTNSSESINAVLKRKVNYKKSELPDFIDRIKEVIDEPQREGEQAIIGREKYKLRPQYSTLEVQEAKWFAMTVQQRQKHILAFHCAEVTSMVDQLHDSFISSVKSKTTCGMSLSISCEDFVKEVNIPLKCLEGIWVYSNTDGAIVPAPGQKLEARMVLSYSGKILHMVSYNKTGNFTCDTNCPNRKGLEICLHSVAVAEVNSQLQEFSPKNCRKP